MDDKELTELAAKAAGKTEGEWFSTTDGPVLVFGSIPFDPLHDDADALRLAVKLGLSIEFNPGYRNSVKVGLDEFRMEYGREQAVRSAITRAAAEKGKAIVTPNVEVQGPGAALSRTVPCNDGLGGADLRRKT